MATSEDSAVREVPPSSKLLASRRRRRRNTCAEARETISELRVLVERELEDDDATDAPRKR